MAPIVDPGRRLTVLEARHVLNCKERGDAGCEWKAAGLALFWPVAYVISRVNEQLTEPKP